MDKETRPGPGRPGLVGTDRVVECGAFACERSTIPATEATSDTKSDAAL